ncbi:glycosyltransferase [Burkholderia sp. Ax-1719]|uniref:glycosyltransferase family 2 protein n=1 Tax=Burkholderia sp. Ax-1719 TaxID=2608334 RepID=UPI00142324EE|nr:glycosyltransferase [Burkholderia sp. Ax-1719]
MKTRKLWSNLSNWINRISLLAGWRAPLSLVDIVQIPSTESEVELVSREEIPSGWYMAEIEIHAPRMRVFGTIWTSSSDIDQDDNYHTLPIHPGRLCKRLIHVRPGQLHLRLLLREATVIRFRVVPVTKRFAHSRIIQKLRNAHPRHKYAAPSQCLKSIRVDAAAEFKALWLDYCALFSEERDLVSYHEWIAAFEPTHSIGSKHVSLEGSSDHSGPSLIAFLNDSSGDAASIERTVQSFLLQTYTNWHLYVVTDSADHSENAVWKLDKRIHQITSAQHYTENRIIADWFVLLECGDVLNADAFQEAMKAVDAHDEICLIFTDEDEINSKGSRSNPVLKPDWDDNLFYSTNLFSGLTFLRRDITEAAGDVSQASCGSSRQAFILRCRELIDHSRIYHLPRVLYHRYTCERARREVDRCGMHTTQEGCRLLNAHFTRLNIHAKAAIVDGRYRVRYELPDDIPSVCLIVPTRNGGEHLRRCITSILQKTTYTNYQILIVDNGSDEPETLSYLADICMDHRIKLIRDPSPFNYSALNNMATTSTSAEVLGLINDDVEVITPEWLTEMVSHAMRTEVGAVGAKLLYGDDTIQHAGVVLGMQGVAGHMHRFLHRDSPGYLGQAQLVRAVSAVTGACLVIKRQLYESVGGLNETDLKVACNDIDFCLRVREAGFTNIWTPFAELYHHESTSRGFDVTPEKLLRSRREAGYMEERWGTVLLSDPAYSVNLSLESEDCDLAWPPRTYFH